MLFGVRSDRARRTLFRTVGMTLIPISVLHSELRLELRSFGSKVLSHANHIMVFSLPAWFR